MTLGVSKKLREKLNREGYGTAIAIDKGIIEKVGKYNKCFIMEVHSRYVKVRAKDQVIRVNYRSKANERPLKEDWSVIEPVPDEPKIDYSFYGKWRANV